ncbi:Rap1a/Tai family immunity protein [Roseomonas sp. AR75]|uniref:Rap1a/Tai family immunity protein n=1 Tax=Roseomonas sp. AR75 TaxID=2562311 RepID=UPI0010C089A1|nr:Rap1a/Tai family immunity protein [Roseomonas sp. AR75]
MRALVLVMLLLAGGAAAQGPDSTAAILPGCQAHLQGRQDRREAEGICLGRLAVLVANLDLIGACPPAEPRLRTTLQIIVDYMEKRSERWGEPFGRFGAEALRVAWPCPAPR